MSLALGMGMWMSISVTSAQAQTGGVPQRPAATTSAASVAPATEGQLESLADALQSVRRTAILGRERATDSEVRELATRVVADVATSSWRLDAYAQRRGSSVSTVMRAPEAASSRAGVESAGAVAGPSSLAALEQAAPSTFDGALLTALHQRLDRARQVVGQSLATVKDPALLEVLSSMQRQLIHSRDEVMNRRPPTQPAGATEPRPTEE